MSSISPTIDDTGFLARSSDAEQTGSGLLIAVGAVVWLVSYLVSNLIFIPDLYQVNLGSKDAPQHKMSATEFVEATCGPGISEWATTPEQKWVWYAGLTMCCVVAIVVATSQGFVGSAAPVFFFCPVIALLMALGAPLRKARQYAFVVAAVYLVIGTTIVGAAYPLMNQPLPADETVLLASVALQIGLACSLGATLKFVKTFSHSMEQNANTTLAA